jgi:hypothetical protein
VSVARDRCLGREEVLLEISGSSDLEDEGLVILAGPTVKDQGKHSSLDKFLLVLTFLATNFQENYSIRVFLEIC